MLSRTWVVGAVLSAACGPSGDVSASAVTKSASALVASNGRELNGRELNGRELNGRELNGRELNGVVLNSGGLNGHQPNGIEYRGVELAAAMNRPGENVAFLDGSELKVRRGDGSVLAGEAVLGAQLTATFGDRTTAKVTIDEMSLADTDVYSYAVSVVVDGERLNWCGTDANGDPVKAIALQGTWNGYTGERFSSLSSFTLACHRFALSKCVAFGYKPWKTLADGTSLVDTHQACTRMVRADYCGDGTSYTRDGTLINLYDGKGIQSDTDDWVIEAEWDTRGARCLNKPRIALAIPACVLKIVRLSSCGDPEHLSDRALLITESPP